MSAQIPAGFASFLKDQLPPELVRSILAGFGQAAQTSIRLNPAKAYALPFQTKPASFPESRALPTRPTFTLDPGWHAGAYYVQEAGSMAVSRLLAAHLPPNARLVLDLCAAPGGKSTHVRSLMPDDCLLVSNEVIRTRVARLEENLERWGHPGFAVLNRDPSDIGQRCAEMFDAILVDAPCSGEGLFRKDEHAAAEWSPEHVSFCAARQQRILADIWPALKPGGVLVYSTCTFNALEDEGAIQFAISELGATLLPIPPDIAAHGIPSTCGLRLLPDAHGTEGQFLAALQKPGEPEDDDFTPTRKDLLRLPNPKPAELTQLQSLLPDTTAQDFFFNNEEWRLLPAELHHPALRLLTAIPIVGLGIAVAEIKGRSVTPLQGLATLSGYQIDLLRAELDLHQSLTFLRREDQRDTLELPPATYLVTHQGLGLGFLKSIQGGRVNNLLPPGRRIRMDIPLAGQVSE